MGLRTLVKLSQVTNLSDSRYAAGMGVQMMGFNINPDSEFYTDPDKFNAITGWISGVDLVGEFDGDVFSFNAGYEFDYVQIQDKSFVEIVRKMNKKVIFKINLDKDKDDEAEQLMMELKDDVEYFLIESNNEKHNPPKLKTWAMSFPIILGFGITEDNVVELIDEYELKGISIMGGEEKVVGFKDYDQLAGILERLEADVELD